MRLKEISGSFALLGSVVPRDAGVAARLRAAGAVSLIFSNIHFFDPTPRYRYSWERPVSQNGQTSVEVFLLASQAAAVNP